jgi:hypothetical protein
MSPEKLETIEAYILATVGAIRGVYEIFIKEPIIHKLGELAWNHSQTTYKN